MDASETGTASDDDRGSGPGVGGTALVVMGGGARAAYGVGYLRALSRLLGDQEFTVEYGVSAGAINVAYLASAPGSFADRARRLEALWADLEPGSIMRVGSRVLLKRMAAWGARLVAGGSTILPRPRGLVDSTPLQELLERELGNGAGIPGIRERLESTSLEAVVLSTSSYTTGEWVVWSQGRSLPPEWRQPGRRSESARLTPDHVLASAALPLFFPAIRLGDEWHGDGEIRSPTPLSPCVALGVDRILAVSTHHGEHLAEHGDLHPDYPPPGQVAGMVLNSAFLHDLASDARRLRRINALLDSETGGRKYDGSRYRRIGLFVARPSRDLGQLAGEYELHMPWMLRHMMRGIGSQETASPGLLSLLSFQPEYLRALMELGEADAKAESDTLAAFLRGEDVSEETHSHFPV